MARRTLLSHWTQTLRRHLGPLQLRDQVRAALHDLKDKRLHLIGRLYLIVEPGLGALGRARLVRLILQVLELFRPVLQILRRLHRVLLEQLHLQVGLEPRLDGREKRVHLLVAAFHRVHNTLQMTTNYAGKKQIILMHPSIIVT